MQVAMAYLHEMLAQQPMVAYMGIVILVLWLASAFNYSSFWFFAMAFLFLFEVDRNYTKRLRREIRSEERRSAYQGRPLSDFESAEWINQAVEKLWPHFLERFISQEILKPIVPWFIDKHKPWTVRKATLQRLELGRLPPKFLGVRTLEETLGDDHLAMDLLLDFAAGENMIAVLSVQMKRRLGLGIWTNIHISRLHIEGKVRVGVKFSNGWPYISRVRACFENSPYVQMTARPLSTHGVNVSELPLIAGWMERMVADVFEQSLVEPNMLVLDIKKLVSCITSPKTPEPSMQGKWFDVQERPPISVLHLNVLEASDLKPSDPNGLADPFVRGSFTTCRFKTKIQRKTLKPRWFEEFEVPIASWELPTLLVLHVRDKDQFHDDNLGYCEIDIKDYRGGLLHDLWLPLRNIKTGRLHISLSITEDDTASSRRDSISKGPESMEQPKGEPDDVDDKSWIEERFEVINLGKGNKGFLSVVSPGLPSKGKSWQQRQGMSRRDNTTNQKDIIESMHLETSSSDEAGEDERMKTKPRRRKFWGRRLQQPTSLDIPKPENQSPENSSEYVTMGTKGTLVRMKLEEPCENIDGNIVNDEQVLETLTPLTSHGANAVPESPSKRDHMKSMAKGFIKHAGKTAHNLGAALNRKGSHSKKTENEDGVETTPGSATPASESSLPREKAGQSRPSDETTGEPRLSDENKSLSDDRCEYLDDKSSNKNGGLHDGV